MPPIEIKNCPVCQSNSIEKLFDCTDHYSSKESFPVCQCMACRFRFTNQFPSQDEIGRYYDSHNYISHSDSNEGFLNKLYQMARNVMLRTKTNLVASYFPPRKTIRLLDIGCGTGHFLYQAKLRKWHTHGIEKSEEARRTAQQKFELTVDDDSKLSQFDSESFDAITLWHVLEHLEQPNQILDTIKKILAKNGVLILALPNHKSFDAQHYNSAWAAYDVPRHLWHFAPNTIQKLLDKHGFSVIRKKRMPLDPFYVALLSEKYDNPNSSIPVQYLRAISVGIISSIHSLFNIDRSSSVIYVAKAN